MPFVLLLQYYVEKSFGMFHKNLKFEKNFFTIYNMHLLIFKSFLRGGV